MLSANAVKLRSVLSSGPLSNISKAGLLRSSRYNPLVLKPQSTRRPTASTTSREGPRTSQKLQNLLHGVDRDIRTEYAFGDVSTATNGPLKASLSELHSHALKENGLTPEEGINDFVRTSTVSIDDEHQAAVIMEPFNDQEARYYNRLVMGLVTLLETGRDDLVKLAHGCLLRGGALIGRSDLSHADDVVQWASETMLKKIIPGIVKGQRSFEGSKGIAPYFRGVIRFTARDYRRSLNTRYFRLHYLGKSKNPKHAASSIETALNQWSFRKHREFETKFVARLVHEYIYNDGLIEGMTLAQWCKRNYPKRNDENIEYRVKILQRALEGHSGPEIIDLVYDEDTIRSVGREQLHSRIRQYRSRLLNELRAYLKELDVE
jgi:hypothetical protein